MHGFILFAMVR
jgi:hypothetical protein